MQAIILVGGKGKRLYPLTQMTPKPMLRVNDKPIVHHQIEMIQHRGVNSITIVAGYQGEQVRDYFEATSFPGLTINVLIEETPLGTAGATRMALEQLKVKRSEPLLLAPGDSIFDFNLEKISADHRKNKTLLTTILVPMRSPYGIIELNPEQLVTSFRERPYLPYPMMSGVYIASPNILKFLPTYGDMKTVLPTFLNRGELHAYLTKRYWKSVETAKDLEELEDDIRKNRTRHSATLCIPLEGYSNLQFND